MDSLLPFACLLLGIALPVVGVGLVVRRGFQQLGAAQAYRVVAERLGLSVDTRGISLQGFLDQRRIWIGGVMVGHGPDRRTVTWGVVDLERPLGLGLLLRRRGLSDRVFRRGRSPEVRLDAPELRRRFEVHGDDGERVRGLLRREVVTALSAVATRWPDVVITDGSVRVHMRRPEPDPERLQALVDALLELAGALEHARTTVPPPPRLAPVVEAWRPLAAELDLTLEAWLPALSGTRDDREVLVTTWRGTAGYTAALRVQLRGERELGLRVQPQTAPDGFWSVGQDIQFEDPSFDRAFVVKGWDPELVRQLLDADAREALLALAAEGDLLVDDRMVRLRNMPTDPATVARALDLAERVATCLGR